MIGMAEMAGRELDGLRKLFEQAPAAMALLRGPTHVFELANPAYLELVNHRDVIGKPLREALPEVVGQGFLDLLDEVQRTGKAHVGRATPVVLQQGRSGTYVERVLDFVYQPLRHSSGEASGVFVLATDVTDRVRAEKTLSQQRRLYEAILTNTPDFAYVFDLQHRFVYANEGLLKMWGKSWDEAIGRTCLELGYEPWHAAMHNREIDQVAATRQPIRGEVPFTGTFGRRIYDYVFVPVFNSSGEVEAVAGTTRDVTERKNAEEALRSANRRKDEFLATLAHELRNPLAPIRNAVHLMKHLPSPDPQLRPVREIIERQVRHMVRLVDDLLDVSRITLGQVTLRNEVVSLGSTLTDAIEASRPLIEAAEHRFTVRLPAENMQVVGDATRLSQVFQNLLNNAAKYTPHGGRLSLHVERGGNEAMVIVRDDGIGIPPELHSRIFELFTRAHPSEEIKTSGLGIGLALAKQLVELHGGDITVRSEGAGKGSEFTVRLPLVESLNPTDGVPLDAPEHLGTSKRRVLVVDDNRDAAESLAMLLKLYGCSVEVALGGEAALGTLARFRPDIVLLDIGMPGMDGYATARHIRSNAAGSDLFLVALTGWGQDEDKRRAREAGFDEHLTKPVDPSLLGTLLTVERAATD